MMNSLVKLTVLLLIILVSCTKKNENESTFTTYVQKATIDHPMVGPEKFIVTMWCPPPADEANMEILKRDGYTLVTIGQQKVEVGEDPYGPVWGADEYIKRLDLARKYGLKAQIMSKLFKPENMNSPSNLALISELIDKTKNHPALDSYYLTDEPGLYDLTVWLPLYNYVHQKDPNHHCYINLFPIYTNTQYLGVPVPLSLTDSDWAAESLFKSQDNAFMIGNYNAYLKTFIEETAPKLISYDHYHFLKKGKDGPFYFLNLALVRKASVLTGIPFLNIVQACSIDQAWRVVNENEMRWLAYTTMVYGGRGISWFLYWGPAAYGGLYQDGKRTFLADYAASINKDISILGPELIQLNSTAVYQTSPLPVGSLSIPANAPVQIKNGQFILGFFMNDLNPNVFMVVNRDYKKSSSAELSLYYGDAALWRFNVVTGTWIEEKIIQSGSKHTVVLQPGGGVLYKVVSPLSQFTL